MHVIKTDFNGNTNVGLYAYATDSYCLVGPEVPSELIKKIEEVLDVPVHVLTIAGTSLLGVFLSGNSKIMLVPSITFESELEIIEKLEIPYQIIDTKLTALGNNIVCNDKGCLLNEDFEEIAQKQIGEALGLTPKKSKLAGLEIIGSLCVHNNKGALVHRDSKDFELEIIEAALGVPATIGTVNFGSPYIKSGVIVNSNGFIIGSLSGGPEIQNADIALGFIE